MMARFCNFYNLKKVKTYFKKAQCVSNRCKDLFKQKKYFGVMGTLNPLLFNSLEKQSHGPSYWKFNSSLLEDSSYIELISLKYSEWLDDFKEVTDKRVLWDLIKYRVRSCTMKYKKGKARERRTRLAEAEKNVKRYELICTNQCKQPRSSKTEIWTSPWLHSVVRGCIVRSRINWYENGEKNSKYFLNLEKKEMR